MSARRLTRSCLQFLLGLMFGFTISFMLFVFDQGLSRPTRITLTDSGSESGRLHEIRVEERDLQMSASDDPVGESGRLREIKFEDRQEHHDNDTIAKGLFDRVRVLVWVMTGPQNLDKRAVHVRNTWGKRASKLLFMSSTWNNSFPTIGLDVREGREHLTAKTMKAFRYIYEHHLDDADWFMKADDDTYVIMENLRYLLSAHDPQTPVFFGQIFKMATVQGYTSGGAGYVISKEALRRLATLGSNASLCHQDGGAEDDEVGRCLNKLGVKLLPSSDRLGRSRFHCFNVESQLQGHFPDWFLEYDIHGGRGGMNSISDYAITFHYVTPRSMYAMEYYIYHLRPFGIISRIQNLNRNDTSSYARSLK